MSQLKKYIIPSENRGKDRKWEKLNLKFFKPPFILLAVGAVGSGKSSYCYSIVKNFQKYFDLLLVITGTRDSNKCWEDLETKKLNVVVKNQFEEDTLTDLVEDLENTNEDARREKKKTTKTLMILDDVVFHHGVVRRNAANVLDQIIANHRHLDISMLFCSQSYMACNRNLRICNLTGLILFRVNKNDLEKIAQEHKNLLSSDDFIEMYEQLQRRDKWTPLVINYRKPLESRFYWRNESIGMKK